MAISMSEIQHLRKMTGAGMMDCKNALNEAEGNFDKAVEIIRKKGQAVAAKREDREASEGCVLAKAEGDFAAVIALNCETDFVAKNEEFVGLAKTILDLAMKDRPSGKEALLDLNAGKGTISELITDRIGATGEKMEIGFYETVEAPSVTAYIHPGNRLATIVGFNLPSVDSQVMKDIAMQIAAMNPISITADEVPADVREKELSIARDKARESGKPEAIIEKIAEGSLNKFFKENTLLEQDFVKDNKMTIKDYLKKTNPELKIVAFKRVSLNN